MILVVSMYSYKKVRKACIFLLCLCGFMLSISPQAYAAQGVRSLYREGYNESEGVWKVLVSCLTSDINRYLVRKSEADPWCSNELPELCADDRIKAAHLVCYSGYSKDVAQLKAKQQAEQAQREAEILKTKRRKLITELSSIERQRAELELRKQSLKNRAQEIQRRQASVREQLAKIAP